MLADKTLFYLACVLITIGIVFSYSLSAFAVLYFGYDEFHFFVRQLGFGASGILIMFALSRFEPDGRAFHFLMIFLLVVSLVAIIALPFLPANLATASGGAKRWIRLGALSISPVEFFKIGLVP